LNFFQASFYVSAFFSVFPREHLIPHSQRYGKRAALGHNFLCRRTQAIARHLANRDNNLV
jgi:hypothetical protein